MKIIFVIEQFVDDEWVYVTSSRKHTFYDTNIKLFEITNYHYIPSYIDAIHKFIEFKDYVYNTAILYPEDVLSERTLDILEENVDTADIKIYNLSSFLNFNWNKQATTSYFLTLEEYKYFKKNKQIYPGHQKNLIRFNDSFIKVSKEEADNLINNNFDDIKFILENNNDKDIMTTITLPYGKTYKEFIDDKCFFEMLDIWKEKYRGKNYRLISCKYR